MPEHQVTIHTDDNGNVQIEKFAGDPHLTKVKQLVDGLRGNVEELKPKAARASEYEKLGTPDEIATLRKRAEEADALKKRISELEETANMTEEEKKELETLRKKAEKADAFGDLDPEAAKEALEFKARTEKEVALSEAFEAAGLKPKAALQLDGVRNLETRVQTETVDGKPKKIAQVKDGDSWQSLDEYMAGKYSDHMPVLKSAEDAGKSGGKGAGTAPLDSARGRPAAGGEPKNLADAIEQHYSQ